MVRRIAIAVLLLCWSGPTLADPIDDEFRGGVLGVPWGSSLSSVASTYPNGDHVFAVTPGCRGYWVRDGQTFLGIPRERNGALFGFDANNHLAIVAVAYPFERRLELLSTLSSLFGYPRYAPDTKGRRQYGWRSAGGLNAYVTEFGDVDETIIWLTVSVPGYERGSHGC